VSIWLNPDLKVYKTEITIDDESRELKTGMSCRAEIIVESFDDAVYVPVQAVLTIGGRQQVFVQNGNKTEQRPVETGLDNNRMVVISAGLRPGESVLLTPPLEAATVGEDGDFQKEDRRAFRKKAAIDTEKSNTLPETSDASRN
jgi:HlyD family secretion protein